MRTESIFEEVVACFENWREIWDAYQQGSQFPTFHLRTGHSIVNVPGDAAGAVFYEIFVLQVYTGDGFYIPQATDIVIDVGANIGIFALFLSIRSPGVRVFCFEPSNDTRKRLVRNVDENA